MKIEYELSPILNEVSKGDLIDLLNASCSGLITIERISESSVNIEVVSPDLINLRSMFNVGISVATMEAAIIALQTLEPQRREESLARLAKNILFSITS